MTSASRTSACRPHAKNLRLALLTALVALCGTAKAQIDPNRVYQAQDHSFRLTTVAEGLVNPWSIAFLPDGDMLVTERPGRLRIVRDGRLLPDPVTGVPAVRHGGQGGLQEVLPHPDFAQNRLLYLSFAKGPEARGTTAIVRGRLENDRLTGVEEIFEADAWSETRGHYGARMAFDADGHLFVSVGDRQAPTQGDLERHPAQQPSNHQGTILRLNDDGTVPDDNPFVGRAGFLPEIWSFGHRNPQGLIVHPDTGDVWDTEHGPQGGDELNVVLPGRNYGWPVIGFGVNYRSGLPIHASLAREGMEQPVVFWVPSIATSGLMVYTGDKFPQWRGNLFAGGMSAQHQRLSRIVVDGRHVATREALLVGELRIRDVRQGPDGYIYLAVDNRVGLPTPIVRMEPVAD